jgi:molybdopterin-guanine dinucleotide biosynthesis protein MobB
MKRLHIVGRKNHGKTTLVVELVEHFKRLGCRVGTLKHTHHQHQLDTPGKDSYRHQAGGADIVGVVSPGRNAAFWTPDSREHADAYEAFAPLFAACDVVLVEGDSQTTAPKIEVWRADLGQAPLAAGDSAIRAVVTDDEPAVDVPILKRCDVPRVADWIREAMRIELSG